MARLTVLVSLVAAILAAEGVSAQGVLRGRSEWYGFMPKTSAPHVVTMVAQDSAGTQSSRTISRRGNWIRVDRAVPVRQGNPIRQTVSFTNVRSRTSFEVGVGDGGRPQSIQIDGPSRSNVDPFTREPTDQRDSVLGETCEIWNMAEDWWSRLSRPLTSQHCITSDGITLWSRTYFSSGEVTRSETAVSLERRQVASDYVRPPSELFNWGYWLRMLSGTSAASTEPDYELTMDADGKRPPHTIRAIMRQHGQWQYTEYIYATGGLNIDIQSDRLLLTYTGGPEGPRSLQITVFREVSASEKARVAASAKARAEELGLALGPVPLGQPTERIVGERCTWFDMSPSVRDAFLHWCRTEDGIPLRIDRGSQVTYTGLTARRLSRRQLSDRDIAPPRFVFDWLR